MKKLLISTALLFSILFSQNTLLVPEQYGSIQEAINSSGYGDTILVASGIYYEHINFYG